MLDIRLGNSSDIPFIMNLVCDGIASGAFFYAEGNGFETSPNNTGIIPLLGIISLSLPKS